MLSPDQLAPQQRAVLQAKTPYIFIHGGVGTFKTTGGLIRFYLHCQMFPRSVILVMAQTYSQIELIYMKEWERQIARHEYKYNSSKGEIRLLKSKSVILLHYSEHKEAAKRILGSTINGFHMIQAENIKDETFFDLLEQRVRLLGPEPNAGYLRIIDANPGAPGHWVHQRFIDQNHPKYMSSERVTRIKCKTTPKTSAYSAETIEQWRITNPGWMYQRMVEGEWTFAEGRVWEVYTTYKHSPEGMLAWAAQLDRVFLGCDPGWEHDTAIVFVGFAKGVYYIFDEIRINHTAIAQIRDLIDQRLESWGLKNRKFNMWVDPSAKSWVGEWNLLGHDIYAYQSKHRGTDPVLNRAVKINELFRTERLIISTLCKYVIQDCERTVYKRDVLKEQIDKENYDPHSMDAVGYAVTQEIF